MALAEVWLFLAGRLEEVMLSMLGGWKILKTWAYSSFMVVVCLIVPGLILAGWAAG